MQVVQTQTYVPVIKRYHQMGSTNQKPGVNKFQQSLLSVFKKFAHATTVHNLFNNKIHLLHVPFFITSTAAATTTTLLSTTRVSPTQFVQKTELSIMMGHQTSMFHPPREEPPSQAPTNLQSYNKLHMTVITYPVMVQPTFCQGLQV